jgi:hypothetical protein
MRRTLPCALTILITLGVPIGATPPNPIVSSLFVPIEGDIVEPGTTNILHLTGEVHVVTHFTVSDQRVPAVSIWANLVRVRGTSPTTGNTYLGVGAGNVGWSGTNPGPPDIPEQRLEFALVNIGVSPGPPDVPPSPIVPVFLRNFRFGAEDTNFGKLQDVDASFER